MSKEKLKNKNHTSHFAPHTSNRGITLISLILTIIIMLILTGVALTIALGDNGIIDKANEAVEATQIATDKELLLSAAIGAMGNDGKVNLSAIVLPEGFTGSNGTYTSKNGNTFTVSENGDIVYTGGSDSEDETGTVDLNGKYYFTGYYGDGETYIEIVDNSVVRYVYYDSSNDEEQVMELSIGAIDEVNKTVEIRMYEDMNNLDVYESMFMPYMLIEENGQIVNKGAIFDEALLVQNEKGIEYGGISGTYYTEDRTKRIIFDSVNSTINGESYLTLTGDWGQNKYINNQSYYTFDGYLFINSNISECNDDYTAVKCDGDTYYKQN